MGAGGARRDIVLDKGADARPSVLSSDQVQSAGLTKMSREWVVMFVPQDLQTEVVGVRNIDAVIYIRKHCSRANRAVRIRSNRGRTYKRGSGRGLSDSGGALCPAPPRVSRICRMDCLPYAAEGRDRKSVV